MNVRLARGSATPIYRQIVDQIANQIAVGLIATGERLPSVRELARALPANRNTVLKAYELLERDRLIERRHGDGTFVTGNGSPLKLAERRKRVGEAARQLALLALQLDVTPGETARLLQDELDRTAAEKQKTGGGQ